MTQQQIEHGRKQSNTPSDADRILSMSTYQAKKLAIQELERERDEARKSKECFASLLKYISDKVPSEGGKEVGDAIDSIVKERDQLRKVADELVARVPEFSSVKKLYNQLPHVIARKETKI